MTPAIHDSAVVGGRIVTPDAVLDGAIVIDDGRITRVVPAGELVAARQLIDAAGLFVLPGVIDSHVHFRTPGLTHKEDWEHGSRAAAAGGVTTVVDMPNTDPPLLALDGEPERAAIVAGRSLVDFRFHPGISETAPALSDLPTARPATAKVFMTGHHTARHVVRDPRRLDAVFAHAARSGTRLLLHAEDDGVFALLDAARGVSARAGYEASRPRTGGIVAVSRVIELVRRHGTAAHVLHVSCAEEVELLAAASTVGLPITFEVTAHHLTFTDDDVRRVGTRLWLSPAIRRADDRERLWQAVSSGEAFTIGSDHAPHTLHEKARPGLGAPPGLPGVQELLAAVHTGLAARGPGEHVRTLARVLSAAPAELCGIAHRKGRLIAGHDADLVLFDPERTWTMSTSDVSSRCGWSAYEGVPLRGRALLTMRRGEVIWDAGTGTFGAPEGQLLQSSSASADVDAAGRLRAVH